MLGISGCHLFFTLKFVVRPEPARQLQQFLPLCVCAYRILRLDVFLFAPVLPVDAGIQGIMPSTDTAFSSDWGPARQLQPSCRAFFAALQLIFFFLSIYPLCVSPVDVPDPRHNAICADTEFRSTGTGAAIATQFRRSSSCEVFVTALVSTSSTNVHYQ
jgi:hypothetical protein